MKIPLFLAFLIGLTQIPSGTTITLNRHHHHHHKHYDQAGDDMVESLAGYHFMHQKKRSGKPILDKEPMDAGV